MKPNAITAEILLTALSPISHHDPAVNDGSNVLTFNRQRQIMQHDALAVDISADVVTRFCAANKIPQAISEAFSGMGFVDFCATALLRLLMDTYNSLDGVGLFSGMERYSLLESRARTAAVKSSNLRTFWANLCRDMQLPIHPGHVDDALMLFFALPAGVQFAAVSSVQREYRSLITIARVWHTSIKHTSEKYAAAAGMLFDPDEMIAPEFPSGRLDLGGSLVLDVPAVSSNSMRHQLVRAPGWEYLFGALEIPRDAKLPVEAEAIFYNGGNIRAGAKQPSNSFQLALKAREKYPILDLLGGVCDSFDLGESMLAVSSWLVCRENKAALSGICETLPNAGVSAFDMLDDITHTRQATPQGAGQMIYNFETLVPGTQFLVRFSVKPYARTITVGALASALETYLGSNPVVAGQSARGFGVVGAGWIEHPVQFDAARDEYEQYLSENRDFLRECILDGTLGTNARVVS